MEYKKCEECEQIFPAEEGERIENCPYCGHKSLTRASEKEWRQYYINIVMQPFGYREIKPSNQTTFIEEI